MDISFSVFNYTVEFSFEGESKVDFSKGGETRSEYASGCWNTLI